MSKWSRCYFYVGYTVMCIFTTVYYVALMINRRTQSGIILNSCLNFNPFYIDKVWAAINPIENELTVHM